jgi:serine/threonine protein kinase
MKPGASVTPAIRLVRCLGVGGMGSVWVADHQALRTQVVVKFMSTELATNAEAHERFSREAAAAAQVKSPHVVQMLDHGITPEGIPFIAMELLEGRDLSHYLSERGRLSLVETAGIVAQVCKALGRAHERAIVHRDIKPENIYLCDVGGERGDHFVKLLDFGIAKGGDANVLTGGTRTGAMMGTPYYMSPEQMMGSKQLDPRTDLWSLGIVVYQCLTGQRPFDAETFGALAIMIHSGPLPRPTLVDPTLPPAFDDWFARACSRAPDERFQTAKDMADALTAVANGTQWVPRTITGPMHPAATGPMELVAVPSRTDPNANRSSTNAGMGLASGRPPAASRGALATVSITAVLVVLAIAGGGVWLARRPPAVAARQSPSAATEAIPPPPPSAPAPPPVATLPPSPAEPAPAAATTSAPAASSSPAARPLAVPTGKAVPPSGGAATPKKPATAPTATSKNERDIF